MGLPIVLRGDGHAMICAAETINTDRLTAMRAIGELDLALTDHRAATLKARPYDGDLARVIVPQDAPLSWVQALADPEDDLRHPMKGPLQTRRDGSAHLHRLAIKLCKDARLLPSALVLPNVDGAVLAAQNDLTVLDAEAARNLISAPTHLSNIVSARVPITAAEATRLHIFRPDDGGEEHYAIEIGKPDRKAPVLARLHSACFTGDLMGSLKCDCGPQLHAALGQMGQEGAGVLLYLNQEGRGIGLANKMRAYSLQDQGFDTVEANHRLGFEDDERDFRLGSEILRRMGFGSVRLLTNNPAKIVMMENCGIAVTERVPLKVGLNTHNERYLATKANKSGHLL
jgi:GTP cyclohydrolase II